MTHLPSRKGQDLVTRILDRRDAVRVKIKKQRERALRNRCFGTNSCDCPRCR